MTEIALRTYNQEIKDLIDHGHFDEAIAHCQHILETFPRHVETYRLLGKAFLEQGRHGDAADVFQRVLSAMPDDWLAHVAMSIVREDESNLDMAIWHMERAYEVNPSNTTVQQEIRRLRGRRDGVEPSKLRLTRSALARMYIKGGLFGQAIAEIRQALSEDADRPDLLILLAGALSESGYVQEAAESCNTLLQKLPYCLEANRILGMVLWTTDRKEDAEKVLQRLESLDPYIDIEAMKNGRQEEHPAHSIMLSHLEWERQQQTVRTKQPNWAASLGVKLEDAQPSQAVPDWLSTPAQPETMSSPQNQTSKPASGPSTPTWLMDAEASMAGTSSTPAPSVPSGDAPSATYDDARPVTGQLPDWIKIQSPVGPPQESAPASSLPDWLATPTAMDNPPATIQAAAQDSVPDWIRNASSPQSETPAEPVASLPAWLSATPPQTVEPLPSSALQDWEKPETTTGPISPEAAAGLPGWLSSSTPAGTGTETEPDWLSQTAPAASTPDDLPNWMQGVQPAGATQVGAPSEAVPDWLTPQASQKPAPSVDILPEWMRSESPPQAGQSIESAMKPPSPGEFSGDLPDWMQPEKPPIVSEPVSQLPIPSDKVAKAIEPTPVMPAMAQPGLEAQAPQLGETEPIPAETIPDWLKGTVATTTPPAAPTAITPSNMPEVIPAEELPDWIRVTAPVGAQPLQPEAAKPAPIPAENLPDWLRSPATATPPVVHVKSPEPESEAAEGLPDWLKGTSAAASSVSMSEPPRIEPPTPGSLPDWLTGPAVTSVTEQEHPKPESSPVPSPAPEPVGDNVELPPWLVNQLGSQPAESQSPTETPNAGTPLPDWLKPTGGAGGSQSVLDWDVAAQQKLPPAVPPDETRPSVPPVAGSQNAPQQGSGQRDMPAWLDRSKPGGGDTVARWLDRRLKTSTLSNLDDQQPGRTPSKSPAIPTTTGSQSTALPAEPMQKPSGTASQLPAQQIPPGEATPAPAMPAPGKSTQMPTWLDSQKPGASDTVVRWIDKRVPSGTGQLSIPKTPPAGSPAPSPAQTPGTSSPATITPENQAAPVPGWLDQQNADPSDAVDRWLHERPGATAGQDQDASVSRRAASAEQTPLPQPVAPGLPTLGTPEPEEEEDGSFVPPPEWLQKTLGSVVSDVPPIPASAPVEQQTQRKWSSQEEPPPVTRPEPGQWTPITPAAETEEKSARHTSRPVKKKPRKVTEIEAEVLLREARVYLESDLSKAADAYKKVIEVPKMADTVVQDVEAYLEQDPASGVLWNLLGDAYSQAGRLQDAYRAYAEALRKM